MPSPLEEYEEFKANVRPLDDPIQEAFEVYADAAIKSLECCGNCKWCDFDEVLYCGNDEDGPTYPWRWNTKPSDHCHFEPSRWKERT